MAKPYRTLRARLSTVAQAQAEDTARALLAQLDEDDTAAYASQQQRYLAAHAGDSAMQQAYATFLRDSAQAAFDTSEEDA